MGVTPAAPHRASHTCLLQFGSAVLHLILRTPISNGNDQLRDISPHPIFHGERLLVRVFECHSCSTTGKLCQKNEMTGQLPFCLKTLHAIQPVLVFPPW